MATKKPFVFKSSKLSSAAEQLWTASKSGFKAGETSVKLDLGRTLNEKPSNNAAPAESTNSKGFVFGSRLAERVIVKPTQGDGDMSERAASGDCDGVRDTESPKTVSAVFESIQKKGAASSFLASDRNQYEEEGASTSSKLKESAEEAQSHRQEPTVLTKAAESVEVFTGEEGEINVFHAMCKLHAFDLAAKTWVERGLGSLRINRRDDSDDCRIVGRITGNQRVVLNSRIFADIILEKVSSKRIKFSATTPDSELPILFLATASEYVTEQLYTALSKIVEKKREENATRKRKASEADNDGDDGVQAKKPVE